MNWIVGSVGVTTDRNSPGSPSRKWPQACPLLGAPLPERPTQLCSRSMLMLMPEWKNLSCNGSIWMTLMVYGHLPGAFYQRCSPISIDFSEGGMFSDWKLY